MVTSRVGMVGLGQADVALADPADDVRGMSVLDFEGHRVGEVEEIVVDEEERRARLLVVVSGGLLGFGETKSLVPVEVIEHVGDHVRLGQTAQEVRDAGEYDPELVDAPDYQTVYSVYGIMPFWYGGYVRPYFHRQR